MHKRASMYVIVVGAGKVGYHLAKTLIAEGHEVLLPEKYRKTVETLTNELGELILHGDGCEIRTMSEDGLGRADVEVAVTG